MKFLKEINYRYTFITFVLIIVILSLYGFCYSVFNTKNYICYSIEKNKITNKIMETRREILNNNINIHHGDKLEFNNGEIYFVDTCYELK